MSEGHNNSTAAINFPKVIFGTSSLGNLYQAIDNDVKKEIIRECIVNSAGTPVFDTAGKYGAGLALETLGHYLDALNVDPQAVIISNKLGWYRIPLTTKEPTFEKGVWMDLENDAVQKISYDGILECFEQGNRLLGNYPAQMVSVHDPDEYLLAAEDADDRGKRYIDILNAYKALLELRQSGKVQSVGIGSKDWKVIQSICADVKLDWVMVANSLTVHDHPEELVAFIAKLNREGVTVINSAVFNGGFLIGSDYYNYQKVNIHTTKGSDLYIWRYKFYAICKKFGITLAQACADFGFNIPGVTSIALNTTKPEKIKANIAMLDNKVPKQFWEAMQAAKLINLPLEYLNEEDNANIDL